jgi:hypothetical protein
MHIGAVKAKNSPAFAVGDEQNGGVSFAEQLKSGELLTGTPTVTEEAGAGDLVITGVGYNTATVEINGVDVPAYHALLFHVTSQSAGEYWLKLVVTTDSTPARALTRYVPFHVVPAPS